MVTRRCTQRQFLLRPDRETNRAFVYCLAMAAQKTGVAVLAFLVQANHHHTVVVDHRGNLPEFLEYLHKFVAKHQNALRQRKENLWSSEPTSVVELPGPEDILAKIIYTLTNPVKDQLVKRADQWPGASSLTANLEARPLEAERPWRFFRKDGDMPKSATLECERPPGFKQLTAEEWTATLRQGVRAIEEAAAERRKTTGRTVLGRREILRQRPTDSPTGKEPKRASNPHVHISTANKEALVEIVRRNRVFVAAYQLARDLWQSGFDALFPVGTYWLRRFAGVPVEIASTG